MLLFLCTELLAAEPSKEIMFSSVTQDNDARVELGAEQFSSFEMSGAYGVNKNLSFILSYGYGSIITSYDTPYREYTYGYDYNEKGSSFGSQFAQHMLSIGPRYSHIFNDWASVYGKVEGTIAFSTMRFTTSLSEEEPLSQLSSSAISFGGILAGGAMGTIRFKKNLPDVLISFELGYSLQTRSSFEKMGDLDCTGRYSSLGIGLRF